MIADRYAFAKPSFAVFDECIHPDYTLQNLAGYLVSRNAPRAHSLWRNSTVREISESSYYKTLPAFTLAVRARFRVSRRQTAFQAFDRSRVSQVQMFQNLGGIPFTFRMPGKVIHGHPVDCTRNCRV